jgi:GNAT superfamily N-acetyltransferase
MHIRPLGTDELDLFVEATGFFNHRKEVEQYLESMFAAGSMRPEWCFVAEDEEDRPLGRLAFWTLPGMEQPFALVLLDADWKDDRAGVGRRLFEDVLQRARALGAEEIEHVVDDPPMRPQFQHHPEKRIELLKSVGFALRRETSRFEWCGGVVPAEIGRLLYRTLEEVGKEVFIEAMVEVSEGTLDREIRDERQRLGAQWAAQEFFEDAGRVEHDPSWWRLAYAPGGELVGLVMPAQPPGFLTLIYIGVVPEMRGRGYVNDLLASGTATLLKARSKDDKPPIADTDMANVPMAAAFERAGWTRFAGRREYVVSRSARQPFSK